MVNLLVYLAVSQPQNWKKNVRRDEFFYTQFIITSEKFTLAPLIDYNLTILQRKLINVISQNLAVLKVYF